ncbi:Ubiquitin fusion degradation protein 1 [Vanrija pseudolonga]|uniref:Ubiquitin fusion degradation protein 1 n=1 Tax=Vanrija pseudolonga TaxID=143232 RepID=A0AAF0YC54_9TREE|nr:Ubiquitin fusion degradation protein 1 [Vanrija pseudolonga]
MNHGIDDDDGLDYPAPMAGPSGLLAQLMGAGRFARASPARAYDEYFKAFSVATMTHGHERPQLMYGGKIIMPPSALAKLTSLDIEGPWTFQLRNPRNPTVHQTHAGVLEFIAEEGIVHLPAWMMQALNLNEGDPVRLTGATLPKGKMVKIQAQSVDFLEVADAKAVLESALRAYSVLTKGDIIEITYNSLTFEFLIMETYPEGPGISIIDTDLEVDFAPPKGYVEPPRKAPAPIPTMADKLKIDLGGTTSADPSRPVSSLSTHTQGSGEIPLESFTGVGQSLSGKRVKGKGLARKIEEVDASSKINRHTGPRIITPDSLNDDRKVPTALVLPAGKFFFGYKYIPFDPAKTPKKKEEGAPAPPTSFQGAGNSLRRGAQANSAPSPATPNADETPKAEEKPDPWASLGSGNKLSGRKRAAEASPAPAPPAPARNPTPPPAPTQNEVIDATMLDEDDFWVPEYDEDEDVIEIDSD